VILDRILDLGLGGVPQKKALIQDMADRLLREQVGSLLVSTGLTTLSGKHLSSRSAGAARMNARELPARTRRLSSLGLSLSD
jgi:hypothetical protein